MSHSEISAWEREQFALRADLEVVRRYGESHADDFVEVLFENEPSVRLVVLMAGEDVEKHDAALRREVRYPERLEVRHVAFTRQHLEEIRDEVTELARRRPGALMSWGVGGGRVSVELRADQEALARQLHERFADAVSLRVGAFAYPPTSSGDDVERPTGVAARLPLLSPDEFAVELDGDISVESGKSANFTLRVRNLASTEAVIDTNGGLTAYVIDPATGEIVGGFVGAQTLQLVRFKVSAGETVAIPLLVGTASTVSRLGYALPPGRWELEVHVTLEGRGKLRTPPLPLVISGPARDG